jgi:hypothetical protein
MFAHTRKHVHQSERGVLGWFPRDAVARSALFSTRPYLLFAVFDASQRRLLVHRQMQATLSFAISPFVLCCRRYWPVSPTSVVTCVHACPNSMQLATKQRNCECSPNIAVEKRLDCSRARSTELMIQGQDEPRRDQHQRTAPTVNRTTTTPQNRKRSSYPQPQWPDSAGE